MAAVRLFVADDPDGHWSELTDGAAPAVRVVADDLLQAKRARARIQADSDEVAVILDVTVAVAADFRSAREELEAVDGVRYAGTVDGLPVGMQVLAAHHRDALLFDVAQTVERERPWPLTAP